MKNFQAFDNMEMMTQRTMTPEGFRAPTWESTVYFWRQILSPGAWLAAPATLKGTAKDLTHLLICFGFHGLEAVWQQRGSRWGEYWLRVPSAVRGLAYAMVLLFLWTQSSGESRSFIYFQF